MDPHEALSPQEAANHLGLSVKTIYRWTNDGKLTGYRLGRRTLRFKRSELDAVMAAGSTK